MTQWADYNSWPDWQDTGRTVEIISEDSQQITGKLKAYDFDFDGVDEFPIFTVEDSNGLKYSFAGAQCWRFIEEDSNS